MGGAAVSRKLLVAVKQFEVECGVLMARSQAKQLTKGFGGAQAVMLDFSGVTMIGQAFADEVFRVFKGKHPEVEIVPFHVSHEVKQMISQATIVGSEGVGDGS